MLPVAARADIEAWEFTSVTGTGTITDYDLGVVFTANQSIIVDELGYYNSGGGYSSAVALYNSGGSLLISADVAS
jgi:hypothetical protein